MEKKAWEEPKLEELDVRETKADTESRRPPKHSGGTHC